MAGLVGYASSDDDDEVLSQPEAKGNESISEAQPSQPSQPAQPVEPSRTAPNKDSKSNASAPGPALAEHSAPIGPSLPPPGDLDLPDAEDSMLEDATADPDRPPQSPYSANRSLVHDLTLPSIPDFDIPSSPPGSPPPAINKKFNQFLNLKKKGVHFNQKLEQSAALKNPNLMDKLMRFVELEGASQYETTLPKDVWNPDAFPQWAYRENLKKSREQIIKEREAHNASGARKAVDFVPASKASTRK